ncbi:MAG: sigma factor-like helix-turn-helix DNA-binding protein, partial [Planctomycetota bacterium]
AAAAAAGPAAARRLEADGKPGPADVALRAEVRQTLAKAIVALPEPYRSVLSLHLHDGLNSQEISARLKRPAATVRKQMARAIQQLRTALPVGFATGLALRITPAQLAERAADAAQYTQVSPNAVDGTTTDGTSAGDAFADESAELHGDEIPTLLTAAATARRALWLSLPAAALLTAIVALIAAFAPGESAQSPQHAAADRSAPPSSMARVASDASVASQRIEVYRRAARTPPEAADTCTLTIEAQHEDGSAAANHTLLIVHDDGRALTSRIATGDSHRVTTDAFGRAIVRYLPKARYSIARPGALPSKTITLDGSTHEARVRLPRNISCRGIVVDPHGYPVAGATVCASQTSARGDLGTVLASTDANGGFAATTSLRDGRLYARHPEHGTSATVRMQTDCELQIQMLPPGKPVTIDVRHANGEPIEGAFVAVVPRSRATQFVPPETGTTDRDGRCTLMRARGRSASLLVEARPDLRRTQGYAGPREPARAPWCSTLPADATSAAVVLHSAASVSGQLVDADGNPMAYQQVTASVAGERSNEPTAPMLARQTTSDDEGFFHLEHLPPTRLQVRAYGPRRTTRGPMMGHWVQAGTTIDLGSDAFRSDDPNAAPHARVRLQAAPRVEVRGQVHDPHGNPISGWHMVAIPEVGTAIHRMFRRRAATTRSDGTFVLDAVAPDESYQVGLYPPSRWWPNTIGWPVAFARVRAGDTARIQVDSVRVPTAMLTCQTLLPNGTAARGAVFELRHMAYQSPLTRRANAAGRARFEGLARGDYWLVVKAKGHGSRTVPLTIEDDHAPVDLGTILLEQPAKPCVRLLVDGKPVTTPVRVVAQSSVGDKFVTANSDALGRGTVQLPTLPAGPSRIAVHGPGIAPRSMQREFTPGRQWFDLELERAASVTMRFPFPLADNPFVINGPLHVIVRQRPAGAEARPGAEGKIVLEDYVGAATEPACFVLATGLADGDYTVHARSIWNASVERELSIRTGEMPERVVEMPLTLGKAPTGTSEAQTAATQR